MGMRQRRKGSQYKGVAKRVLLCAVGTPFFQDLLATTQSDSGNCLLAGLEARPRVH